MLYKKYRPTTIDDMLLPEVLKNLFKDIGSSNKVPQSLIIHSELGGVGKTTVALALARLINCHTKKLNCKCPSCSQIKNHSSKDIIMMDGTEYNTLDKIKGLKPYLMASPSKNSKYRVIIIDELHRLSQEAQSLFLEFLEFSQHSTIYMFTTTNINKIIPPLVTRMSKIALPTPTFTQIWNYLLPITQQENINISKEDYRQLVVNSKGSLRQAMNDLELFRVSPTFTYNLGDKSKRLETLFNNLKLGNSSRAYYILADLVSSNPTEELTKLILHSQRMRGSSTDTEIQVTKAILSVRPKTLDETFLILKMIIKKDDQISEEMGEIHKLDHKPTLAQVVKPSPLYEDPTNTKYASLLYSLQTGEENNITLQEYNSFKKYMDSLPEDQRQTKIPSNEVTRIFMERYYRDTGKQFSVVEGTEVDVSNFLDPNIKIYIKGR